jgi:hypothetical protein
VNICAGQAGRLVACEAQGAAGGAAVKGALAWDRCQGALRGI